MDDRIRISDADRVRVTARLREHFAEGRLSSEELDERITATLNAKTVGDLRLITADLPEPTPASLQDGWSPRSFRPVAGFRRGPRLLPLALLLLLVAFVLPGPGFVIFGFLRLLLVIWLVTAVAGIIAAARFRRRMRRHCQSSYADHQGQYEWHRS